MSYFIKLSSLISIVSLCACVSLLPDSGEKPARIWLEPTVTLSTSNQAKMLAISISRPTATHMLDSDRLRIRNFKSDIPLVDQVAGVEWQDHLPLMVQRHLVETLLKSKKFKAVGFDEDSFRHDVVLEVDIQNFDIIILKDKIYAEVIFSVKLLKTNGREVIWQKTMSSKVSVAEHKLSSFVIGITKAYENVLQQVVQYNYPQKIG